MPIAEHPLHRSGRAALPHPAPTSGGDAQALGRIGMADAGGWQPSAQQGPHATPGQMIALTAPSQHSPPRQSHRSSEGNDCGAVHRDAVVAHVTENDRTQVLANLGDGVVHARLKLGFHRLKLRLPPFAHRLTQHRKAALALLPAAMREAKEVKAPRRSPVTAIFSIASSARPELDQSRLLGMHFTCDLTDADA